MTNQVCPPRIEFMEQIVIKELINHKNKYTLMPVLAITFALMYTGAGVISNQNAGVLEISSFENSIPFLPWTIWIYFVLYPVYLAWALLSFRNITELNKTLFGFLLLAVISCIIFILFPLSYPRGYFPLAPGNDLTTVIFRAMRAVDKPSNCFPSLHVGLCYLFAYGFLRKNKMKFAFSFSISTLISISTLTTKQHYIVDVLAGYGVAVAIFYLFDKMTTIKLSK